MPRIPQSLAAGGGAVVEEPSGDAPPSWRGFRASLLGAPNTPERTRRIAEYYEAMKAQHERQAREPVPPDAPYVVRAMRELKRDHDMEVSPVVAVVMKAVGDALATVSSQILDANPEIARAAGRFAVLLGFPTLEPSPLPVAAVLQLQRAAQAGKSIKATLQFGGVAGAHAVTGMGLRTEAAGHAVHRLLRRPETAE